jgi:hypothetical protein
MDRRLLWLRICYWVGAIVDGLWIIPMLFPSVGGALFGIEDFDPGGEYRYAMAVGAALMAGWTALLLWADRRPVERRGVLLLTIVPVLVGLDAASVQLVRYDIVPMDRMVASWIQTGLVHVLFIYGYVVSRRLAPESEAAPSG